MYPKWVLVVSGLLLILGSSSGERYRPEVAAPCKHYKTLSFGEGIDEVFRRRSSGYTGNFKVISVSQENLPEELASGRTTLDMDFVMQELIRLATDACKETTLEPSYHRHPQDLSDSPSDSNCPTVNSFYSEFVGLLSGIVLALVSWVGWKLYINKDKVFSKSALPNCIDYIIKKLQLLKKSPETESNEQPPSSGGSDIESPQAETQRPPTAECCGLVLKKESNQSPV